MNIEILMLRGMDSIKKHIRPQCNKGKKDFTGQAGSTGSSG
jgi:hypothetical protein